MAQLNTDNDAQTLEKSIGKSNAVDTVIEIICTRTNGQLNAIKKSYKNLYESDLMEQIAKATEKGSGSFRLILQNLLTGQRSETLQVDELIVLAQTKKLHEILEEKQFENFEKQIVINMISKNSWHFLNRLSEEYQKLSNYDLPKRLESKWGTKSIACKALLTLLETARHRLDYWARQLRDSMKGMGTNDALLQRIILGRSEIDLGQIISTFALNKNWGEGKTALQWIKDDTSGIYCNLLLMLSGLYSDQTSEESKQDDTVRQSVVAKIDVDEKNYEGLDWDQYVCSTPTVIPYPKIDITALSKIANDKMITNDTKIILSFLIKVTPRLNIQQRLAMSHAYKSVHPHGSDLVEAFTKELKKTTSLPLLQSLYQSLAAFDASSCKKAIKAGKALTLGEIIASKTNKQLAEMAIEYKRLYGIEITADINEFTKKRQKVGILLNNIINGKRPEELPNQINIEKVKDDVSWLTDKKKKFAGKDKEDYIVFFAERSWEHLKKVAQVFQQTSDISLLQSIKKNLGKKVSAEISQVILEISVDRADYFAGKIAACFKGMSKDVEELTRIIISRSEIDLASIRKAFTQNYGDGKSLNKWIESSVDEATSDILLGLLNCADNINTPLDLDGSVLPISIPVTSPISPISTPIMSPTADNESALFPSTSLSSTTATDDVVSKIYVNEKGKIDRVNIRELSSFMKTRLNEKTANNIWERLDRDKSGTIEEDELLELLNFTAILQIAYRLKKLPKEEQQKGVDKDAIKKNLIPIKDWITKNRMKNGKIEKQEYLNSMGIWLEQYAEENKL